MIYYFLALLIWLVKILLWVSVIGIPIERYVSFHTDWFDCPFTEAEYTYFRNL